MLHYGGLLGNLMAVVIQDRFCLNQHNVNIQAHPLSLLVTNRRQLGFNKSVEPHCKKFPTLIIDPKTDHLRQVKMMLFIFHALDDKGTSMTALELPGEFKKVLEFFGFVLVTITGTRSS